MNTYLGLWIGLTGLALAGQTVFAQNSKQTAALREQARRARHESALAWMLPRIEGMAGHLADQMDRRQGLDDAAAAQQAILDACAAALEDPEQMESSATYARLGDHGSLLHGLLLDMAAQAVLAERLPEDQARELRREAVLRDEEIRRAASLQMAAWADWHLSLRPDQRLPTGQALLAGPGRRWLSILSMVRMDSEAFADLSAQVGLDPSGVDPLLTDAQAEIWRVLTPQRRRQDPGVQDGALDERRVRHLEDMAEQINRAAEEGRITRRQADERLEGLKRRLGADGAEPVSDGDDPVRDPERALAAAVLAVHTEQLGVLDDAAARRLALVSKGVQEAYLESQDTFGTSVWRLVDHPLYQDTIRTVLSEEAYAAYRSRREDQVAFREQAQRDVAVAYLDARLLLSDVQRACCHVSAGTTPVNPGDPAAVLCAQIVRRLDPDRLSPWQRGVLEALGDDLPRIE